ncbi:STN and carboxypeptidase regulatory-like domain-containing protein [Pedobacter insulae]|uniref:CarboxypepD_reg-like domain-containing protein n=1 Tax=Pedobacter insulae TaxID=414048 RepID=A0A1I2WIR8_9SPHI|nr:STN and carboxypeptidase regulatory-like domain-containing protein [Pedobacter insulae]SFH01212.1 hypothetical protein SAMN04489864_10483 [Pedobacter insulae]
MKHKIILFLLLLSNFAWAQGYRNNLSKLVTFNIKQQRVRDALQHISTAGNFYFSYNGKLINQDSVIDLNVQRMPVRDVLDRMFAGKVAYKESEEYVILRYAVNHLTIEPENITTAENLYLISGYIVDTKTGKKVKQASVYEKRLLQSTLTDDEGYFTLRFKGEHKEVILTASKETYRDTALVFLADIKIEPQGYNDPDKERGTIFSNTIEDLGISKFLLSSKQRIQNLNIPNFFANTPFQASLLPGLSSHGMMSSRVVNKASLNVLGGYTAGVDGVEVAGLFNLTIGKVNSFQAAGLFNAVGGDVQGTQFAGLINYDRQNVGGFQAAGIANSVSGNLNGVQIGGIGNLVRKDVKGVQIAGIGNMTTSKFTGTQIAGVFNYAKKHEGLQIGLINLADSSSGTSIGLLNLSKNGYKKLSFFSNDLVNANVALKTGNAKLYTLLIAGKNFSDTANIETIGIGFGHDFLLGNRLAIETEMITQYLHLGNWDYANILMRFQANLEIKLFKGFAVFGGPSYAYYNSDAPTGSSAKGYKQNIVPAKHHKFSGNNQGWWGWNVGVTLF